MDVMQTEAHEMWEAKLDSMGTEAKFERYQQHLENYPKSLEKSSLFKCLEGFITAMKNKDGAS